MNRCNKFFMIFPTISLLFSCLLGVTAMTAHHIPPVIWGLNLGASCLLSLITLICIYRDFIPSAFYKWMGAVSILLLLLTFADSGLEGVHRWIHLGPFTINAAMLSIPPTIAALFQLFHQKHIFPASGITAIIALLLFLQPDASQLTGFSAPMILILLKQKDLKFFRIAFCIFLCILTVITWILGDPLLPVDYTEGILLLLGELSFPLLALGIFSLFLLPVPFVLLSDSQNRFITVCIALYYWLITLSSFFGNFPVPVMGYGISPIIGYLLFYIWLARKNP